MSQAEEILFLKHSFVFLGNIKVDIPWTSLFSASVVVRVEDLYLLAGPVTDRLYDPERERALQNALKRQILESLETENAMKMGEGLFVACQVREQA